MKKSIHSRKTLCVAIAAVSQLMIASQTLAGPEGGKVVGGRGSIDQSGLNTTVQQQTDRMAIDWQSFDVAADERVQFIQPSSSSLALNRVLSHTGSEIHGRIEANGHILLVNPNGVFFGENSHINVGGMIASGLSIDPADFMNGEFTLTALEGTEGAVINSGIINAATGGSISLIGQQVKNEGMISARLGAVNLAAGKEAVVTFDPQGLVGVRVTKEVLQDELGVDAALINNGEISAEGGRILLTASTSQDIFSQAVNRGDLDSAGSVVVHDDGSFTLGAGADVVNAGTIDVSSDTHNAGQVAIIGENVTSSGVISADSKYASAGSVELHALSTALLTENSQTSAVAKENKKGGEVKILGHHVGVLDQARIDTSGATGGGSVLIGGDFQGKNNQVRNSHRTYIAEETNIYSDALTSGDGGKVIVWADEITRYYGSIFARGLKSGAGGFAEISGKEQLDFNGYADLSSDIGKGTLLLDPTNLTIVGFGGSDDLSTGIFEYDDEADVGINASAIVTALGSADVILQATNSINVNADISANQGNENDLTFQAGNTIRVDANINLRAGDINFVSGINGCGEVDCASSTGRNFSLISSRSLNTTGNISIKAADNITISGVIGNNFTNSVSIQAGNNIVVDSSSSVTADLNSGGAPTILLAAGDVSLSGGENPELVAPYIGSGASVIGNLSINGSLTTNSGDIFLSATGDVADRFNTGVVDIRNSLTTSGGNIFVVNSGRFTNSFNNGDYALNTRASGGAGDISIISGGDIELGSVNFSYPPGTPTTKSGSVTAEAGGNFTLTRTLAYNDIGPRNDNGQPYGHDDQPFLNFSANGNVTIEEKIYDSISDARDSLNITLTADKDNNGSGGVFIDDDIYTSGGNFTASGNTFTSAGQIINTDDADDDDNGSYSLGGDVSISASSSIVLGIIKTDANCSAGTCSGNLTISRRSSPLPISQMNVTQASGELTINGRTTIDVGSLGNVTFTDDDNSFTGGFVLTSARDVNITDSEGDITLNGVNVRDLTLTTTNGGISQASGSSIVTRDARLSAGGSNNTIVLNGQTNDFTGTVSANTNDGDIRLRDVDSFILGSITSDGGDITLNAGLILNEGRSIDASDGGSRGDVEITGTIDSTNLSSLTITADDITFGGNIGATNQLGGITLYAQGDVGAGSRSIAATSLTANDIDSFTAGNITTSRAGAVGGSINITSDGAIALGSLNTQGLGNTNGDGHDGGSVILNGSQVNIGGINTSGADAGAVSGDPAVMGTSGTGGVITITADSSVSLGGDINANHGDAAGQGSVNVNLDQAGNIVLAHTDFFTSNVTLNGSGQTDTLSGFNIASDWVTTSSNSGRIDNAAGTGGRVTFNSFENLHGGSDADEFTLNHNISGRVRGGDGDDRFNIGATIDGDIFGQGDNDIFVITSTGDVSVDLFGEAGDDTIQGPNRANAWSITNGVSSLNDNIRFSGVEIVTGGNQQDIFRGEIENFISTGSIDAGGGLTDTVIVADNLELDLAGDVSGVFRGVTNAEIISSENVNGGTLTVNSAAGMAVNWGIENVDDIGTIDNEGTISYIANETSQSIIFTNFANLIGGDGNDIFSFSGNSTITGSINGRNGVNQVDISGATRAHQVGFGTSGGDASIHLTNIQRVVGNDYDDTRLILASGNNTWNITDFDADGTVANGVNDGVITATNFEVEFIDFHSLVGGSGSDHFVFASENPGRISGSVDGGGGADNSITGRDASNAWIIAADTGVSITADAVEYLVASSNIQRLQGGSGQDVFTINADIDSILGGEGSDQFVVGTNGRADTLDGQDGDDTLVGRNDNNEWNINDRDLSINDGPTYIEQFVGMEILQGGSSTDEFIINNNFVGTLNGGAGDDTFRVFNNGAVTLIDGGTHTNGDTLDLTDAGNNLSVALNETTDADFNALNIERADANSNANHTLIGSNSAPNEWNILDVNEGTLNGTFDFSGFANLMGGDLVDEFIFANSNASITGVINGGSGASVDLVNLVARGSDSRVQVLEAGDGAVANSINVLGIEEITADADFNNILVASDRENTWQITGTNTGTLNKTETAAGLTFTNFQNAVGGNQDDTFSFVANGNLTGTVDGGTHIDGDSVDKSLANDADVRLADVNGAGFINIERYIGNNADSTIFGDNGNNNWVLGAEQNSVVINDNISFEGFANLQGGAGRDTFRLGQGLLTGSIRGGDNNDTFVVNGGTVQGGIYGDAGDDTLTADISAGAVGGVNFVGGDNADQLIISGGNENYTALHNTTSAGGELVYTDAAGNNYTVSFEQVGQVNDNLRAASLMVNGTSTEDVFTLTNNRYRLNNLTDINYTNKNNLVIAAASNDQINIEGVVNVTNSLTLRNARVTANSAGLITANSLRLDGTAQVGSADNRLITNVNSLYVTAASGGIYLQEQNALDVAELSSNNLVDLRLGGNLTSSTPLIFSRDFIANTTGGDIILTGENELTGNLSFTSNGLVELRNTSATNLGDIQAQNLTIDSTGAINGTGVLTINGLAEFATAGDVVLTNANNNFNSVRINSANAVTLQDSDLLSLTGATANGAVDLTAQSIAVNGVVDVGSLALNAGEEISLGSTITTTNDMTITTQGLVTQQSNVLSETGDITINASQFTMNSGTQIAASAGNVNVNTSGDMTARSITAAGDVNLDIGGTTQINDLIRSTAGSINLTSNNNVNLAGNLEANNDIVLQSLNSGIQQQGQLSTQQGNITLTAAGDIAMGTNAVATAASGGITYTGSSIAATSFIAEAGTVTLAATRGAITDGNGDSVNVTANRLVADALTGIGAENRFETMISELSLSNNTGLVDLQNGLALTINRLHSNGDVVLHNLAGDITLDNTSGTLYDQSQTDSRLAGGTANANYEIGTLTINVANGNLLGSNDPGPNIQNPDIVARSAVLTTPVGSIGSPDRMLVIYVKDYLFIGGARSWGPLWGFDTRPTTVDNQATIQGSLSDLLASGNEQLVEVETLDEVDPAVFTNVRNYFYDDIAIMLPRDQQYYDEEDE